MPIMPPRTLTTAAMIVTTKISITPITGETADSFTHSWVSPPLKYHRHMTFPLGVWITFMVTTSPALR